MKDRIIAICRKMKREQWIVCGLAGLLLLVIATPVKKTDSGENSDEKADRLDISGVEQQVTDIRREYEQQLTEALSQVEGVGEVKVTVTMESTGKKIVEKDNPQDEQTSSQKDSEGSESNTQSSSTQETTVYAETEDGSQTPYISSETYPEIRGVLVVAKGGGDPVIVQQIQEAVMALFHVDAHKIKVLKMK
ncbi:MAG: stage III sporulation protein AG [Oliverpabstia sp.]|nr:stage III sporulation protein AG [Lachnospiraceae bacterium]MDY5026688.1 stage III sporulation protein AG [Oliverpabstia sp.]